MDYLITQFGKSNEPIDEDLLEDILDEISTLKENAFELALASIELGKPQILDYLLETYDFSRKEIKELKECVEDYVKHEEDEGMDPEDIEDIVSKFEEAINSVDDPRKRNWEKRLR